MTPLKTSIMALRDFIAKANAEFPDVPMLTLTFPTREQRMRFLTQMKCDFTIVEANFGWHGAPLPPGIDAEIMGMKIALRDRQS